MNEQTIQSILKSLDKQEHRLLKSLNHLEPGTKTAIFVTKNHEGKTMIGYFTEEHLEQISKANEGKGDVWIARVRGLNPNSEALLILPDGRHSVVSIVDWNAAIATRQAELN